MGNARQRRKLRNAYKDELVRVYALARMGLEPFRSIVECVRRGMPGLQAERTAGQQRRLDLRVAKYLHAYKHSGQPWPIEIKQKE